VAGIGHNNSVYPTKSPYVYLLRDESFRRWFDNLRRGSEATAFAYFAKMGMVHRLYGKSPSEIVQMTPKEAYNFLLDIITSMENQGKSYNYVDSMVKCVKNWLDFNEIKVTQKIRLSNEDVLVKVGDERPPMPNELRKILSMGDFRSRVACAFIAFSGVRPEVLGHYLGKDGLQIRDLPELEVLNGNQEVRFSKIPAMVVVRSSLSKAGHQYFTFLPEEGCQYLKESLEWRMRQGQKLGNDTPIITPKSIYIGSHMRTTNISDKVKVAIKAAGYGWRPYVLRRYFATRMMLAESEGLIVRDWRVFWMGHAGDIEHTYTVNKGLPEDILEKMRLSYEKAANRHLQTYAGDEISGGKRDLVSAFNIQILKTFGIPEEEIEAIADPSSLTPEEVQSMIRRKSMELLGLKDNKQKIVTINELESYIVQGWEYVKDLPTNNKVIIRLPD